MRSDIRLETDRLLLRPFKKIDLEDLAALNADKEAMKFISSPLSRDQVEGVIDWFLTEWQRLEFGWFAVFEKATGNFIGQCGLQCLEGRPDSSDIELAFVIKRSSWGKGYATEAAEAVVGYGFLDVGLERIVAVTMKDNLSSQHVLDKLAFQYKDSRNLYGREVMYYELARTMSDAKQSEPDCS